MSCRAGRTSCPSQADGPEMAHQTRWSHAAIGRDIRRRRHGMSPRGDDGQDVLLETIERWSSRTRSQDRTSAGDGRGSQRQRSQGIGHDGHSQIRLRFLREPPDRTIRRLQGRPNERKSPQECIPSPSCRPEQPQETMPLRFWHRLREDGGQGSGSRPEPERQTRPSEMKVSLRTRRQALSEPVLRTADGVDPSGQRVVRGPSQRQQGSPRLRPEVGPGPQVRSPAPRGAVRKP